MNRSKYSEARTLVRALRPLPGEAHVSFKNKVNQLRRHFEQFNKDVSDLCQWLMGIRPGGKIADLRARPLWHYLLEPIVPDASGDQMNPDQLRLLLVAAVIGWRGLQELKAKNLSPELLQSIDYVSKLSPSASSIRIFERLRTLDQPHQIILLKAAAEWVYSKYARVAENRQHQFDEWKKEKNEWEKRHSELTPDAISRFNQIFKDLNVEKKRPRICRWAKLKEAKKNCDYAGERINLGSKWANHSPLCKKFRDFMKQFKKNEKCKKEFVACAADYMQIRYKQRQLPKQKAMELLFKTHPKARKWFPVIWADYLKSLDITEETIYKYSGTFHHCANLSADKECTFNPHTDLCFKYKNLLKSNIPPELLNLEGTYRDWRANYLVGPKKPDFRYPSSRTLPTPKIFGNGYYHVDFDKSVLGLRLEGMPPDEFLNFAFEPWPPDYDLQPKDLKITSVQVNFIGTKARVGFRFNVPHSPSRFGVTQDELDELRSRKYPRPSQDAEFLKVARDLLFSRFQGDPHNDLRILAVDLGETGASAIVLHGEEKKETIPLKIIKLDRLYERIDKKSASNACDGGDKEGSHNGLGLGRDHVGRHLDSMSHSAAEIASKRQTALKTKLRSYDLRRLTSHIRWMLRDWVRLNAAQIIAAAVANKVDLILFESLRGFRAPGYDKIDPDKKQRLAFFAYGQVRRKTTEKAVERGMRVITVPYFYSSQFCSKCGRQQQDKKKWSKNKRTEKSFKCEYKECGFSSNSDENAALVLAKVFYAKITLPRQ